MQWRYQSGGAIVRDRYTYIDKELWAKLSALVEASGGVDVEDREDPEIGLCDGGTELVYIKSGDKTGYYYFDSSCEGNIWRSDKAGREALPILEAISDEFDVKSR